MLAFGRAQVLAEVMELIHKPPGAGGRYFGDGTQKLSSVSAQGLWGLPYMS